MGDLASQAREGNQYEKLNSGRLGKVEKDYLSLCGGSPGVKPLPLL